MAYEPIFGPLNAKAVNRRNSDLWTEVVSLQADTVTLSVAAESGNAIVVTGTMKDSLGATVTGAQVLRVFLSDAATGLDITGTGPTTLTEGATGKVLAEDVAVKMLTVQTATSGVFTVSLGSSGTETWYLVAVLPTGKQVVSSAITFA